MSRFEEKGAASYENRIRKLVPGYDLLHLLTAAKLKTLLPEAARILVIGAGTGTEIIHLAEMMPSWTFTALDISQDMLAIAQRRIKEAGHAARMDVHVGPLSQLTCPNPGYDAVLCLLVLHFIADHKAEFLADVARRLKPRGIFVLADLMEADSPEERHAQGAACALLGLDPGQVAPMLQRLERDFYPWTEQRFSECLQAQGFEKPTAFFRALGFQGFWARYPCSR